MVRTKVVQTLYAYYKDGEKTPLKARQELLKSYSDTYSLYAVLLDFVNELTRYAQEQHEEASQRAKVTHMTYKPNLRFIQNRFAQQMFENNALRNIMTNEHLEWDSGMSAVSGIYKQLVETDFYKEYMAQKEDDYEADKKIWRKIYTELLTESEVLSSALEEMELVLDRQNWTSDSDLIISYIIKTIKRFQEENGANQELLPMFEREDELDFGTELLHQSIAHKDEYQQLIYAHLKNWDPDRVAYMDKVILLAALAEIINFPNIALEVSINEYIEIAKEYSGDKSHIFINGILDEILREMKRNDQLPKAVTMR
jgi:N utilization substance protein B